MNNTLLNDHTDYTRSIYLFISDYKRTHKDSHFFDPETLKFFGERLSEMRVLKSTTTIQDFNGVNHICYIVSSLQRNAPCGARRTYHYFDVNTLDEIID